MGNFNFADAYKIAGLSPGPDIISRRQEPFSKLRSEINARTVIDLTRLYFGLNVPNGTEWFRSAFAESDPSFSMIQNERETAVLSACLLMAAIQDRKVAASLAPLTTAAAGNRTPVLQPQLLEDARQALHKSAIVLRPPSKPGTAAARMAELREEVDMLWWYVGGWSRLLEVPFSDLGEALSAVMAGLDLADLTSRETGPAAAPAILQRLITDGRKTRAAKVTISSAVDELPREVLENLELGNRLKGVQDVCPVLAAFSMASEIGDSPVWHGPFTAASQLDPGAEFSPLELAVQVYREGLLLKLLE